jgi:hypothetical protein
VFFGDGFEVGEAGRQVTVGVVEDEGGGGGEMGLEGGGEVFCEEVF